MLSTALSTLTTLLRRLHFGILQWAKIANLVFLEAPIGTGYSYTEETDNPHIGDERTARDSHTFLERFLGPEYFPQFQKMEFHIWGESYAGVEYYLLDCKYYPLDCKCLHEFVGRHCRVL